MISALKEFVSIRWAKKTGSATGILSKAET